MSQMNLIGKTILGYTVTEKLGSGVFGTVYKVEKTNLSGQYVRALKHITIPTEKQYDSVLNSMGGNATKADSYFASMLDNIAEEIRILNTLSEKGVRNIVRYYENDIVVTESPRRYDVYILMEYLIPLDDYIKTHDFCVKDVVQLGIDVLNGLSSCHNSGVIHRDIKDDNIFVSGKGEFKIGDFGVSKVLKDSSKAESLKGTPNFLAPEVYLGKESYNKSVDLYSLGIVLYRQLNYSRNPFLPHYPEVYQTADEDVAFARRMNGEIADLPSLGGGFIGDVVVRAIRNNKERYQTAEDFLKDLEAAANKTSQDILDMPVNFNTANRLDFNGTSADYKATICEEQFGNVGNNEDKEQDNYINRNLFGSVSISRNQVNQEDDSSNQMLDGSDIASKAVSVLHSRLSAIGARESEEQNPKNEHTLIINHTEGNITPSTEAHSHNEHKSSHKKVVIAIVATVLLIAASAGGFMIYQKSVAEKEYAQNMEMLQNCYNNGLYNDAENIIVHMQTMDSERVEGYEQEIYLYFLRGEYVKCIKRAEELLTIYPDNADMKLILASVYFETEQYDAAAQFISSVYDGDLYAMQSEHLRDYAVCLGRMGKMDEAEEALQILLGMGVTDEITSYVRGEFAFAEKNYYMAEQFFTTTLNKTEDSTLYRRSIMSLAETYQADQANTKLINLVNGAMSRADMKNNSVLYEMLGLAYYNRGTQEKDNDADDLSKAAEYFQKVIDTGITKDYLYVNVFMACQLTGNYETANNVLEQMEQVYPQSYVPHALRSILYISEENQKEQSQRDYRTAYQEYLTALDKVKTEDDTTYLQQVNGLISQLESNGWL